MQYNVNEHNVENINVENINIESINIESINIENINIYDNDNIKDDIFNNNDTILKSRIVNTEQLITKKKKLIDISKNLTKIEYLEIFNIIQNDKCNYSENKNGIFINLLNVGEETIDKIFNFIDFIKHKKQDLIKQEEYVNNFKKNMNENEKKIVLDVIQSEVKEYTYDSDEENNNIIKKNYLHFSSDEEEDLESKLSLKKKKTKYSGNKAKMIRSIKDNKTLYS